MKGRLLMLALLLAAGGGVPAAGVAQMDTVAEARMMMMPRRGPVDVLLEQRQALQLSDAQVVRLQQIQQRMRERNQPHVERLLQLRREARARPRRPWREMTPAERMEARRQLQRAQPLLQRIRENNRAAMQEVGGVLTAAQKEQVRAMLRERRGGMHEGGPRGPQPGARRPWGRGL